MSGVALLFLVKATVLALFVTPLWDVPDETGHYAIVADLADGRGLPLPGRSVIAPDVLADWTKGKTLTPEQRWNWVAQHPPLYHLVAVPFLEIGRAVTRDPHGRYKAPRLLSSLSGALALLVFFRVFAEASGDPLAAFVCASSVGFLPMFSHMSSGTNHDVFLALLCGVAALFFVRFFKSGFFADGMKMGAALALSGAVKLSALPVAAALLLLSWSRLATRGSKRFFQWLSIAAISISLPALWTLRHWWLLGNARIHPVSNRAFDPGRFLSYLRDDPVVDHTFKNFVGLIGWTGTGAGTVHWFQISGAFLAPYLLLALAVTIATAWYLWHAGSGARRLLGAAAAVLVFGFSFFWLFAEADGGALAKRLLYSLFAAVAFLAMPLVFGQERSQGNLFIDSQLVFLVFALAYLVNSFGAFEVYGQMRATNGRYFFAVLPFLGMAFLLPAISLWPASPRRDWTLLGILAALCVSEAAFFLLRVLPFYGLVLAGSVG